MSDPLNPEMSNDDLPAVGWLQRKLTPNARRAAIARSVVKNLMLSIILIRSIFPVDRRSAKCSCKRVQASWICKGDRPWTMTRYNKPKTQRVLSVVGSCCPGLITNSHTNSGRPHCLWYYCRRNGIEIASGQKIDVDNYSIECAVLQPMR